ncbi:MAG: hypothetical protein IJ661_05455 [Lachnospiraceae bacterium]|nr:hypothetical protein [Lachnospiraceae bacterium]
MDGKERTGEGKMQESVFDENVDYLYQVQTDLEAVEQLKKEMNEYKIQEKNLKKSIASEEKSIQDEIAQTIKRRKNEIEKVYDDQIDANKAKSRAVWNKRDKAKSKRIGERVSYETSELAEENRQLQVEMRTLFKAQHIPSFCRSGYFYALFMTKRAWEIPVLILTILAAYIGIPLIVYLICAGSVFKNNADKLPLGCTLIVSVVLFVITFIYVLMINLIKIRHYDTLLDGRQIRDEIAANKRQMKAIRNKINKDKDDSQYGLDKYDDKLAELENELAAISAEKQDAMTVFESETKQVLTNEVNDRRLGHLESMKERLDTLEENMAVLDEDIQNSLLAVANNYGAILGKEFCTPERVADLISLMEDGTADTVSEAIAAYKGAG